MTPLIHRRVFLMILATCTAAFGTFAHARALVDEKDPRVVAVG